MKKRYYSKEVAAILGVSRMTLLRWDRAGKIPKSHVDPMSKYRFWYKEEIDKLKKVTGRGEG